jgi:hypothetical protein
MLAAKRTVPTSLLLVASLLISCASDDDPKTSGSTANQAGAGGSGAQAGFGASVAGSSDSIAGAPNALAGAGPGAAGSTDEGAGAPGVGGQSAANSNSYAGNSSAGAGALGHRDSIEPEGVYEDDYGISQRVDASSWTMGDDRFSFVEFKPADDYALAQNAATNAYFPGLFSRFDWTTDERGALRYCQTAYNAASAADAAAVAPANANELVKGCGGFPWSALRGPAIVGRYIDDYQGSHIITGSSWVMGGQGASKFNLLVLSNTKRTLIAQNDAANSYNPSKFSRFDWTIDSSGALYYCQTAFAAGSAAEASQVNPADAGDLKTGCGGFPWTSLRADS